MASSNNEITVHLITGQPKKVFEPHVELANLPQSDPKAIQQFTKRWGPLLDVDFRIQELLRDDWRGGFDASHNRPYWMGNTFAMDGPAAFFSPRDTKELRRLAPTQGFSATIWITAGRIEVEPNRVVHTALLLYMRDRERGKTAICANPECETPYIVRERKNRKVCGDPKCVAYLARPQKKRWWDANGEAWRARRKKR